MKKKIEIVSSTRLYDDGEASKRLEEEFNSVVYKSVCDYWEDIDRLTRNEEYRFAALGINKHSVKRTPEERSKIIAQKIAAQRRLDQHHEEGGTEFIPVMSLFEKENAPH